MIGLTALLIFTALCLYAIYQAGRINASSSGRLRTFPPGRSAVHIGPRWSDRSNPRLGVSGRYRRRPAPRAMCDRRSTFVLRTRGMR